MTQTPTQRPPLIFLVAFWMAINIFLMITILLNGDVADPNNWLEIALWAVSIGGLLSMRKWGVAFAIVTLVYTLSTSVGILSYYLLVTPEVWPNALRVAINIPIIVYLFRGLFKGKYPK